MSEKRRTPTTIYGKTTHKPIFITELCIHFSDLYSLNGKQHFDFSLVTLYEILCSHIIYRPSVEGRAKGGRGDSNHDELRLFQRADKKWLQHFQEFGFYFVFLIGREF